jgi:Zn-dependent M28 family amino/carboxypeptidase
MRRATPLALLAVLVGACGGDDPAGAPGPDRFDADRAFRDLRAQVDFGPRPAGSAANRRLVEFLADQLRNAGVRDVRVQRPHANVVGTVPGTEDDALLLAAHHDTKDIPGLVGANDGASGVAVVLELARALPDRVEGPSVHFALFDAEEARGDRSFEADGLRGSRQYVAYARASRGGRRVQGTPPLREIQSMILLDLVGDCDLQIPREANSDAALYEYIALQTGEDSPFGGTAPAVSDDHVPFLETGVDAVDLIDFTYGPGPSPGKWWHTTEDTLDKVCPESLDAVGEAVLGVLPGQGALRTETDRQANP